MTPQLAERLGVMSIPMTMRLGQKEFIDDENLDLPGFMVDMKACKESVTSAAPPPFAFMEAIESAINSFVVTISSQLSASYANAQLAKSLAEEKGITDVHIFDTKSASAGEVLIAIKIRELLANGVPKEQVINTINGFIDNMKTYFVLERYENLIKNGRLNKITGKIVNILNVKLILGSDGEGSIAMHAKPRGTQQMLDKIVSFIKSSGRQTEGENMVICHCNNLSLAQQLSGIVKKQFNFKEIFIVPTKGAISLYADDKGIVMAF
jgi:DegV family protein with EDD domain